MLTVALTVVFAVTGLYCLWRVMAARSHGIETLVDVNHVLMSPAMVVMLWWPVAGGARWVQLVIFAGMALVFVHHLNRSDTVTARTGSLLHAGMNVGMVWMLLAMPSLMSATGMDMKMDMAMGHQRGSSSLSGLVGMQAWAALLSWVAVGLLTLAAVWWLARAARAPGHRTLCSCHGLACAGMAASLAVMIPGI